MKTIKVGSDFSGVGAFNQALMRLGINYQELFACDMDKYARQTFIHNYGEPEYYPMNVYDREIPNKSLDIYMTSPPCQAFSIAGKRLGKEDERGILFFNSLEFIRVNNPRFFIFENVKGLLSHDKENKKDKIGRTFQEWIDYLGGKSVNGITTMLPIDGSVPYHLHYKVLNSKKHGVPQNRERVFLIGIRDNQDNTFTWPEEEKLTKRLKDVLENEVEDKYFLSEKMIKGVAKTLDTACNQGIWIADYRNDEGLRIRKDNISPCMAARKHSETDISTMAPLIGYDYKIRRLTPRECFRLMDFPDTFTWSVSDSQAYKQAGNSIVVRVLEKIINNLPL